MFLRRGEKRKRFTMEVKKRRFKGEVQQSIKKIDRKKKLKNPFVVTAYDTSCKDT